MDAWISVEDRLPENAQYVLVWDAKKDTWHSTIYLSGDTAWDEMPDIYKEINWNNNKEEYIACRNRWDRWEYGPFIYENITHWKPGPLGPNLQGDTQ